MQQILIIQFTGDGKQVDEAGHNHQLKTRALKWPECESMNVNACRTFIEAHIDTYDGDVLANLQLVIRRPRAAVLEEKYWMNSVASNVEVVGQSQCQLNNGGAAKPRALEWEYAHGSTVALEDVECRGMTNAECCDAIWAHGGQLGTDKNGNQLMCYVYQEPMYPFFAEENGR
jgi:hypothetical protein